MIYSSLLSFEVSPSSFFKEKQMDKQSYIKNLPRLSLQSLFVSVKAVKSSFLLKMCEHQCFCFPVCVSARAGFCVQTYVRIKAAKLCLVLGLFWFLHPKGKHIVLEKTEPTYVNKLLIPWFYVRTLAWQIYIFTETIMDTFGFKAHTKTW